jgi:hypothetical protein
MAVGKTQHRHLMLTRPLLGKQLFSGINGKAPTPFLGLGPNIATGPNLLQHQGIAGFVTQQQGTAFEGRNRDENSLKLRNQTEIRPYQSWRFAAHTDTL